MTMREEFEAWMVRTSGQFDFSLDDSDEYRNLAVRECYDIWQASRAAALEEAAKLADEHREQSYGDSASYALEVLADELRTLAKEPADNARAGLGGE